MRANKDVLLVEPCPDLLCGLCHDVLDEPLQIRCPEDHIFCTQCITQFTMQNASCPTCQVPIDTSLFQPSKFVQRQIGRLRARCLYKSFGCEWVGLFADDHVLHCQHQFTKCTNAERGCSECPQRNEMQRHQDECPFALINCPNQHPGCSPFLRTDQEAHERRCQSYPCKYRSSGCTFSGTLPDSRAHCDAYCEKLHSKLAHLEAECRRLERLLTEKEPRNNSNSESNSCTLPLPSSLPQTQSAIDDMDILQILNCNTSFSFDMKDDTTGLLNQDFMKLGSNDFSFEPAPPATTAAPYSPVASAMTSIPQVSAPTTGGAPKRAPNGRRIKYSKNVRLAHNALRLARQQDNALDPLEAVLREFDIEGLAVDGDMPMAVPTPTLKNNEPAADLVQLLKQQSISSPPQDGFAFDSIDDMTKFLDSLPAPINEDIAGHTSISQNTQISMPSPPPTETPSQRPQITTSSASVPSPLPSTPPQTISSAGVPTPTRDEAREEARSPHSAAPDLPTSQASTSSVTQPKKRPMFVLASSYLSNYK